MKMYGARHSHRPHKHGGTELHTVIVERFPENNGDLKLHPRPGYTLRDGVYTALWLNDRERGYPVPESLKGLLNDRF